MATSMQNLPVMTAIISGGAVGRTWTLSNTTDSVTAYQGGVWSVGVTNFPATYPVTQVTSPWVVSGTVSAAQSGVWSVNAVQSGAWTTGRTWTLNNSTDSVTVNGTRGALTDRSGSATNVASTMMTANSSRNYIFIQNTSGAPIWINFTTTAVTASPSIELRPNDIREWSGTFVPTEAISVIAGGGTRTYTAKEG